jgi:hypothetical protein
VSHLISIPPGFLGPSWWHILKQSWKTIRENYGKINHRAQFKCEYSVLTIRDAYRRSRWSFDSQQTCIGMLKISGYFCMWSFSENTWVDYTTC